MIDDFQGVPAAPIDTQYYGENSSDYTIYSENIMIIELIFEDNTVAIRTRGIFGKERRLRDDQRWLLWRHLLWVRNI